MVINTIAPMPIDDKPIFLRVVGENTTPRPNNYYAAYNREDPDGWKFFEHDSEHSLGTGEENMVSPLLSNNGCSTLMR